MSINTYVINNCVLVVEGSRYAVKEFSYDMSVGISSSLSCEILTGIPIGNSTDKNYNAVSIFSKVVGSVCSLIITINKKDYTIFKGIITSCCFNATAGGLSTEVSYTISISIAHIGAALGSFNIGNRVFTPHGQSREPFRAANRFIELGQAGSCETDGAKSLDVAAHVVQLVTKYKNWVGGSSRVSPKLTYTPLKLNTAKLGAGAESNLKRYILQATTTVLNNVQMNGSVLDLLTALCNEFFLHIIPTLDGLHITHSLPCYQADKNSFAFTSSFVFSNTITSSREILPPTAVWVPRTFTPNFVKLNSGEKLIHNPLYKQTIQNNDKYFKYPETNKSYPQNALIIEPPTFLKLILNNAVDITEGPNSSSKQYGSTTSQKAHSALYKSKTKVDVKQALGIGQLIAKLLYCNYAYGPCTSILKLAGGFAISNNLCKALLGTECTCSMAFKGAKVVSNVVGYVQGIQIYFNRDNASFDYQVILTNIRHQTYDKRHSIAKSENLLYTGAK